MALTHRYGPGVFWITRVVPTSLTHANFFAGLIGVVALVGSYQLARSGAFTHVKIACVALGIVFTLLIAIINVSNSFSYGAWSIVAMCIAAPTVIALFAWFLTNRVKWAEEEFELAHDAFAQGDSEVYQSTSRRVRASIAHSSALYAGSLLLLVSVFVTAAASVLLTTTQPPAAFPLDSQLHGVLRSDAYGLILWHKETGEVYHVRRDRLPGFLVSPIIEGGAPNERDTTTASPAN